MDSATPQLTPAQTPKPDLTVAAALIVRNSRLLVCQRHRDDSHPLQWEFPGGKVELGESPAQALARELREELGVEARIGEELYRTRHRYADSQWEFGLIFFRVDVDDSAPLQNLVFEKFEWADISSLPRYDFLEADKELVNLLASRSIQLDW
jgi:8-oxo-dGTP diphosphatase